MLGLGESYMDGWWECERLDMFFSSVLRAGLEKQLPRHFKDTLRIASARLFNLQSKKRAWIVGKEHYDLGNDLFSRMLESFNAVLLRILEKSDDPGRGAAG